MAERATPPEPLLREVTGRVLRRHRHERGERLVETAGRAGVSTQYLSELERGRKDDRVRPYPPPWTRDTESKRASPNLTS